uniref:Uncharacterized protein n=1 Tax=viral metagenome TaxID=1070528 RepID=A0A6C0H5K1_9ZZZZ
MLLNEYCLVHITKNLEKILEDGKLITAKNLYKKGDKFISELSGDIMPYIYMTVIKKKDIVLMELYNYYINCGIYVYLVFDISLLIDYPFYINKCWSSIPMEKIIKDKTNLLEIIGLYSNYLKNEIMFMKNIVLKKYLVSVNIPINYKINIRKINEIIREKYKNVVLKIINPKYTPYSKMKKFFIFNKSLDKNG